MFQQVRASRWTSQSATNGVGVSSSPPLTEEGGTTSRRYEEEERLEAVLGSLELEPKQHAYLTERFLPYLRFLEDGAHDNRLIHYALRIPTIVLATILPALIAADPGAEGRALAVALGVIVAATTAVEHFLNSGERWRHYRATVERLKSQAWLFVEEADPTYRADSGHRAAFPAFAAAAEQSFSQESVRYVTQVVSERPVSGAPERPAPAE